MSMGGIRLLRSADAPAPPRPQVRSRAGRLCVGGTSATCLLVDGATGLPTRSGTGSKGGPARMYDWSLFDDGELLLGTALVSEVL